MPFLEAFGSLHPVVLHLPIGLVAGLVLLEFSAGLTGQRVPRVVTGTLVVVTAASAVFAASTGWFLGRDGYDPELVGDHRLFGLAVAGGAVLAAVLFFLGSDGRRPFLAPLYRVALAVTAALLVPAGHLGGTMTHGVDYVDWAALVGAGSAEREAEVASENAAPEETKPSAQPGSAPVPEDAEPPDEIPPEAAAPEESTAPAGPTYAARIAPILAAKCVECHGPSKRKGALRLHTPEMIEQGGGTGPVVLRDDPAASELLARVRLPLEDDEHMPPEGKPQLAPAELRLLESWVLAGAPYQEAFELADEATGGEAARSTGG